MKKVIFVILFSLISASLFADLGERIKVGDLGVSVRPPKGWSAEKMKNGDFCLAGKIENKDVYLIFFIIPEGGALIPLENKILELNKKELGEGIPITGAFNSSSGIKGRGIYFENFSDTAALSFLFSMSAKSALLVFIDKTLPSAQIFELQSLFNDSLKTLEFE